MSMPILLVGGLLPTHGLDSPSSGYVDSGSTAHSILAPSVTQKVDALVTETGGPHVGTDDKVKQAITARFSRYVRTFLWSEIDAVFILQMHLYHSFNKFEVSA